MNKVTIYTTPTCHYCDEAKKLFEELGVSYTTYNVLEDKDKLAEMVELTGRRSVPVIRIGEDTFLGFDKAIISARLKDIK